jgi:hypothetical protein
MSAPEESPTSDTDRLNWLESKQFKIVRFSDFKGSGFPACAVLLDSIDSNKENGAVSADLRMAIDEARKLDHTAA